MGKNNPMRAVLQRIRNGSVSIEGKVCAEIPFGLLVYLGVGTHDTLKDCAYITDKITKMRIFGDEKGKMNLSVRETGGGILLVSQFTLFGDVRRGRRPSYSEAALSEDAEKLYLQCRNMIQATGIPVAAGVFGAMMNVSYINEGPVTILLDSQKLF